MGVVVTPLTLSQCILIGHALIVTYYDEEMVLKPIRIVAAVLASGLFSATNVLALNQSSKDGQKLQSLFSVAEVRVPVLDHCGMHNDAEKIISTLVFLEKTYSKLSTSFRRFDPPIDDQLRERNKLLSRALYSGAAAQDRSGCDNVRISEPTFMNMFSDATRDALSRLNKRGIPVRVQNEKPVKSASCPYEAQYYQDAYLEDGRVDDLICFNKALAREM